MRYLLIFVASALAACGAAGRAGNPDAAGGASGNDSGGASGAAGGGSGGSTTWQEPDRVWHPPEPIIEEILEKDAYMRAELPPGANAAMGAAYWLTGDEELALDLRFGFGTGYDGDTTTVRVSIYLDGIQQRFLLADRGAAAIHEIEFARAEERVLPLTLPAASISDGAHSMLISVSWPSFPMRSELGISLAVYKNSTDYDITWETLPFEISEDEEELPLSKTRLAGTDRQLSGQVALPPGEDLELEFEVAGPYGEPIEREFVVIATLDGIQLPFAGVGSRPIALRKTGYRTTFGLTLPVDGTYHGSELELLVINDPKALEELPDGLPARRSPDFGWLATATLVEAPE